MGHNVRHELPTTLCLSKWVSAIPTDNSFHVFRFFLVHPVFDGRCASRIYSAPEMREHGARGPVGYQPTNPVYNISTAMHVVRALSAKIKINPCSFQSSSPND